MIEYRASESVINKEEILLLAGEEFRDDLSNFIETGLSTQRLREHLTLHEREELTCNCDEAVGMAFTSDPEEF